MALIFIAFPIKTRAPTREFEPPNHEELSGSCLDADAPPHGALAPWAAPLSSLSQPALRVCPPRQEPDAVVPHVRICGGGAQQRASLLRPSDHEAGLEGRQTGLDRSSTD